MLVLDWAKKMQTIPWGVCVFLWKVSFKWNQRVLQKVEGFEATRFIWETIKSNFTAQNFCLYLPISKIHVAFNIIKSTLRGIDRSGVPHIAMQFTTLGFLSRRRSNNNATFCRHAKKLQHIALRNFIPQSLFIYLCSRITTCVPFTLSP